MFRLLITALKWLWSALRPSARSLQHAFRISSSNFTLAASDLGKYANSGSRPDLKTLYGRGLVGKPDAIFVSGNNERFVVGELKGRKYKSNVRPREYYQVVLYIGMLKIRYPQASVVGRLAFKDAVLEIPYDPLIFDYLLSMREDTLRVLNGDVRVDTRPLLKRTKVSYIQRPKLAA